MAAGLIFDARRPLGAIPLAMALAAALDLRGAALIELPLGTG